MKTRLFDRKQEPLNMMEQDTLVKIERLFAASKRLAPASGFSRRWLARIQAEHQRSLRVRASWLAIGNGAVAILVFGLLFAGAFARPVSFVTSLIDDLLALFSFLQAAILVIFSVFQALPVLAWVPFFSAVLLLSALWALLFQKPIPVQGEMK